MNGAVLRRLDRRRVPRQRAARRGRRRLGHRRPAAVARRLGPATARERARDGARPRRCSSSLFVADQRRALQPGRLARRRRRSACGPGATLRLYLPAQIVGCIAGAMLANLMFGDAGRRMSTTDRLTPAHLLAEVVATAGLVLVIFAARPHGPVAVDPRGRRRLHRRRLLLHELDELRQPGHHDRADVHRHLRRHRPARRPASSGAARRRCDRLTRQASSPRSVTDSKQTLFAPPLGGRARRPWCSTHRRTGEARPNPTLVAIDFTIEGSNVARRCLRRS